MKGTIMTRIHINASTPYDVVIEEGALQRITDYIKPLKPNCRVIIVSDSMQVMLFVIMCFLLVKAPKMLINSSI